jgi:hypothetical protein
MSRRAGEISVKIPRRPRKGPTHVVIDSTGLKIFGEGEWKVRQHGVGKRRTWRKMHLAVDETTKDIIGIEVTTADWGDSEVFPGLLDQVDGDVSQVSADGAYDTKGCHAAIADRDARATIPPREGAVPWGNDHPRDAILKEIDVKGSAGWKNDSGYHRRSLAENMMYRVKQLGRRPVLPNLRAASDRRSRPGRHHQHLHLSGHAAIRPGRGNCACGMKQDGDRGSARPKRRK